MIIVYGLKQIEAELELSLGSYVLKLSVHIANVEDTAVELALLASCASFDRRITSIYKLSDLIMIACCAELYPSHFCSAYRRMIRENVRIKHRIKTLQSSNLF